VNKMYEPISNFHDRHPSPNLCVSSPQYLFSHPQYLHHSRPFSASAYLSTRSRQFSSISLRCFFTSSANSAGPFHGGGAGFERGRMVGWAVERICGDVMWLEDVVLGCRGMDLGGILF